MNSKDPERWTNTKMLLRTTAGVCIIIQFIEFSLLYNFTSDVYFLGLGWLILPIGLWLVIVSSQQEQTPSDIVVKRSSRLYNRISYPIHFGWMLISIALSLITQQLYSLLLTIGVVTVVILDIKNDVRIADLPKKNGIR